LKEEEKQKNFLSQFIEVQVQLEKYCLALTNNKEDAFDMMGETIAIALEKYNSIQDPSKFKFYLFGIASNLLKKSIRKLVLKRQFESEQPSSQLDTIVYPGLKMDVETLYKAIHQLPEIQAECLVMYELNEFKIREISELLKLPESTVKTNVSRARKKLIEILNPKNVTL
jgi:RNA polymerase sigma-70 factor (ECF subfamily)